MIAFFGVITLFLAPVALIITIVQAIRKKAYKKWLVIFGVCCVCFTICLLVDIDNVSPTIPTDDKQQISETEQPTDEPIKEIEPNETQSLEVIEKTEAEKFAEDNDISVELAQSIEYVLGEIDYSLSQAYNLEQTDDWAYGRRFKVWIDMEHICFFYCQGEEVVSLRSSNGDFVWQAEE